MIRIIKSIVLVGILNIIYGLFLIGYVLFKIDFVHKNLHITNISFILSLVQFILGILFLVGGTGVIKRQRWGRSLILSVAIIKISFIIFLFGGYLPNALAAIYFHIARLGAKRPFLVLHDIVSTLFSIFIIYYLNKRHIKLEFGINELYQRRRLVVRRLGLLILASFILLFALYGTLVQRKFFDGHDVKVLLFIGDVLLSGHFWIAIWLFKHSICKTITNHNKP